MPSPGAGLSCDGQVRACNFQAFLQSNRTSDAEDDRPVALAYSVSQRAGNRRFIPLVIRECSNLVHRLTASAACIFASSFSAGECWQLTDCRLLRQRLQEGCGKHSCNNELRQPFLHKLPPYSIVEPNWLRKYILIDE